MNTPAPSLGVFPDLPQIVSERAEARAPRAEYASRVELLRGSDVKQGITVVSLLDFVTRDIPPRERILAPWLLTQSLNMIYAWRGIGKTHVALGIAYATASGGSFLKWKAIKPRRVLYIDGEMPAASMQDRLKGLVASNNIDFDPDYFKLITPDLQTGAMPDLATADGQDAIDAVMGDTELIVIDNLSCLARSGGRENDAESWLPIQPWALRQRQQGRSVLFLHHSGKGGAQRGTSKKEDILDTVLTLKRPADYNPADGAVFEVHFEKTRDMHGDDAEPFEARLQADSQGQSEWTYSSVEDSTFDRVVTLANEGLSQKEITEELGINKSTVSRHFRRGTDAGLIQKGGKHEAF
ncbi:MAG: AAA family ATPase [Rhodocyclales bacterium]|nr:AAA family ATPase [Rhodocyclales bacterium]